MRGRGDVAERRGLPQVFPPHRTAGKGLGAAAADGWRNRRRVNGFAFCRWHFNQLLVTSCPRETRRILTVKRVKVTRVDT